MQILILKDKKKDFSAMKNDKNNTKIKESKIKESKIPLCFQSIHKILDS